MLYGRGKGVTTFHPRIGKGSIKTSWVRRSFAGSGGLAELEKVARDIGQDTLCRWEVMGREGGSQVQGILNG